MLNFAAKNNSWNDGLGLTPAVPESELADISTQNRDWNYFHGSLLLTQWARRRVEGIRPSRIDPVCLKHRPHDREGHTG